MSDYNQEDPSNEEEPPEFVKAIFAAVKDHREKVELEAQGIAQKLRLAVYQTTDQLDGPSESDAFTALRQWRKAVDKLGPIMARIPDAHKEAVATAIVSMVDLYKRASCPCAKCRANREGQDS